MLVAPTSSAAAEPSTAETDRMRTVAPLPSSRQNSAAAMVRMPMGAIMRHPSPMPRSGNGRRCDGRQERTHAP